MRKIYCSLMLIVFISCSNKQDNKTIINHELNKHDSLTNIFTTDITSYMYFILKIKRTSNDKGIEVCTETCQFGRFLKESNMLNNLFFDVYNKPYVIDSNNVIASKYQLDKYDIKLVDSLTKKVIPVIIGTILKEAKLKKYKTLQKYDRLYDKYFIHALLRQDVKVIHDCETGDIFISSN